MSLTRGQMIDRSMCASKMHFETSPPSAYTLINSVRSKPIAHMEFGKCTDPRRRRRNKIISHSVFLMKFHNTDETSKKAHIRLIPMHTSSDFTYVIFYSVCSSVRFFSHCGSEWPTIQKNEPHQTHNENKPKMMWNTILTHATSFVCVCTRIGEREISSSVQAHTHTNDSNSS